MKSARAILALSTAAPLLSGCIAAAALPVLAAGGVVKTRMDDPSESATPSPRVAIPADQAQAIPAPASTPSPPGSPTAVAVVRGSFEDLIDTPGAYAAAPLPSPVRSPTGTGSYAAFTDFAARQAAIPAIGSERQSALLVDPGSMQARTRTCSIHPPAVLIDVDPTGSTFDAAQMPVADADFAGRLAALRTDGVTIGWVSARTADRAGDLRRVLRSSGLDPAGRDELVLLRFPEERKQTRRDDFAKAYCVVALAGDERADFDELFKYLRDPALALSLDTLIGKGWFLVPSPLN